MIALRRLATHVAVGILVVVLRATNAHAQNPPAPPPPVLPPQAPKNWAINASGGFALTGGNSNTSTINVGYELIHDPHQHNVIKSSGLYLRADSEDQLTADRLTLVGRDEYKLADGIFVYGQAQYLRDRFKEISYLVAPTGGLGYRVLNTATTVLTTDFGVGGVWEKNPAADVNKSGAFTFGEKLQHRISAAATLSHGFTALYRLNDFSDVLYVINAALASSISTKTQLKVEVVDTFKNRPPSVTVKKNDVAVLVAIVYKN
jgi:putative salt-induced outer membrane protein YdiY